MLTWLRRNRRLLTYAVCVVFAVAPALLAASALGQIPPIDNGDGYFYPTTVQFAAGEFYVAEDGGTATIAVTLSASYTKTVTIDYQTDDGTATAPTNYQATSGTLTFSPGQTSATFQVTINNTGSSQDLNLYLSLSNPTGGAALGIPSEAVLTIVAPNATPSVEFAYGQYYVAADDGSATIRVTLSEASSQVASVSFSTSDGTATSPTDYQAVSGTLEFPPDQTTATFQVPINNVGSTQNLTVNLNLSSPSGATLGPSTAVLTIIPANYGCSTQ
jgi:hypothetical protein